MKYAVRHFLPWVVTLVLLVGCGGGGHRQQPQPEQPSLVIPPANSPVTFENEYDVRYRISEGPLRTDSHLGRINAAAAYARGATGAGETIVFMDTGLWADHREFAGKTITQESLDENYTPSGDEYGHGTATAGIAVANRDSLGMHGVAFDADLYFISVNLGDPPDPGAGDYYTPVELADFSDDDADFAEFLGYPIHNHLGPIINYSFGAPGAASQYATDEVRQAFPLTAAALAQADRHPADRQIVVWAAGNAYGQPLEGGGTANADSPEFLSGLGIHFPELRGHVIAVVALDQDGTIASYSNRCGAAAEFCLAAPGSNIVFPLYGEGNERYGAGSGTSFAAPVVSGGLAVLRQFFRNPDGSYQIGNTELVQRLLFTANREGIYADIATYGQGLMDLDAATRPVGAIMTALPGDADSQPFAAAAVHLSNRAFGGQLSAALGDAAVAGFDQLGAPFAVALGEYVRPAPRRSGRAAALRTQRTAAASGRLEWVANGAAVEEAVFTMTPTTTAVSGTPPPHLVGLMAPP